MFGSVIGMKKPKWIKNYLEKSYFFSHISLVVPLRLLLMGYIIKILKVIPGYRCRLCGFTGMEQNNVKMPFSICLPFEIH